MCKGTCQKRCMGEAMGLVCGAERTAQHAPAVKIPVGLRGSAKTPITTDVFDYDLTDATFLGSAMIEIKDPREVAARMPSPTAGASVELLVGDEWVKVGTLGEFVPFASAVPVGEIEGNELATFPFQASGTVELVERSDMAKACEIGSRLGKQIVAEGLDETFEQVLFALRSDDSARYNLLKLIEQVGLKNWTDGDFVVLSMKDANTLAEHCNDTGMRAEYSDPLHEAIERAANR